MTIDKFTDFETEYPIDSALAVFYTKYNTFFIGFMDWSVESSDMNSIVSLPTRERYKTNEIVKYRYVLNDKGGFLFISPTALRPCKV
jgi:hypothetical protein